MSRSGGFLFGLLMGGLLGAVTLLPFVFFLSAQEIQQFRAGLGQCLVGLWKFAEANLRGSMLLFTPVLIIYWRQLLTLGAMLDDSEAELSAVVRCEQVLDLCATLFFGIGVTWTAIGMREALLSALGNGEAAAPQSAFLVLQRLVDGGILLALSTTIVGGVGGYAMRALKSVLYGRQLTALYMKISQWPAQQNLDTLHRIERHLSQAAAPPERGRSEQ